MAAMGVAIAFDEVEDGQPRLGLGLEAQPSPAPGLLLTSAFLPNQTGSAEKLPDSLLLPSLLSIMCFGGGILHVDDSQPFFVSIYGVRESARRIYSHASWGSIQRDTSTHLSSSRSL
jgi:hypothetical protein